MLSQSWESALGTLAKLQFGGAEANLKLGRARGAGLHNVTPLGTRSVRMLRICCSATTTSCSKSQFWQLLSRSGGTWWNMLEHGGTVPLSPLWVLTQHWNLMATCSSSSTGLGLRQSAGLFSWIQEKKARSHVLHCDPLDSLGITIFLQLILGMPWDFGCSAPAGASKYHQLQFRHLAAASPA